MKLYIWEGVNVLRRCGRGIAFAMANSPEEARDIAKALLTTEGKDIYSWDDELFQEWMDEYGAFLKDEPSVYDMPTGRIKWGSD